MFPFFLPLVGLLIGIPGIPGLSSKLPKLHMPHKAATDTIPPVWKTASLLAVEDGYVFAALEPIGPRVAVFKIAADPRRMDITLDPDSSSVTLIPELGDVPLSSGKRMTLAEYDQELWRSSFEQLWIQRSRESISAGNTVAPTGVTRGPGFKFDLPTPAFFKPAQSLLGPGGPSINVTGSENIKLSGTSQWSNQQTGLIGQRRSLFPALDMQQDLDIHLEGQLSDRVKVNLLQNSATQIPLANKIAINYRGDEDDLVQSLDLGNTNLSLPGTQYVSYSGYNEGLFGMKSSTRLGPLDFTLLASKQEGKSERASYAGGASRQQTTLNDFDYVRGVYFFLYDPNLERQAVQLGSIRLYLDDGNNYTNQVNAIRGRAFVDPRAARTDSTSSDPLTGFTPSVRGRFRLLTPGAENDYEILTNVYTPLFYVIRLKTPITGEQQRLAVTYNYQQVDANEKAIGVPVAMGGADTLDTDQAPSRTMKLLRAPLNLLPARNDGSSSPPFETDPNLSPFAPTRELELRNFYNLGGQKIDPKTFTLKIRHGQDQPYSYSETVNDKSGLPQSVPYIEVLGLDSFDETGGTPIYRKSDGVIDGTLPTSTSRLFVDYENGTLFFFDPRPFAPRIKDDPAYPAKPFDKLLSNILFRRDSLTGVGDSPDERNSAIYDVRNPIRSQVSRYYMDLDFAAARLGRDISLGRNNIIENSEAVTVNGRRLERNRDYTIDYDLGKVTLTAQPGPTDQINVDYGYAPLFQQAGRTLVGSAFRLDGVDKNVGGAFLYESKGAQDLRPRLGEEPSRVLIGDLNGTWNAKPSFLTRWVDALPGVRTTTPSTFNATAEVGASFPNPNTFNEVFIDDMEGVRDAVSLTMASDHWRWSSTPRRMVGFFADSIQAYETYAETHWFNPINAVKERDLKPNLTDAQGAQNPHVSLALSTPRRPPNATPGDSLWVGLTYPLDPVGLDLSRAQYIELWVNDFNDGNKNPRTLPGRLKLHIDVGVVSEDQRRSPGIAPNGVLDTEDQPPRDNQLTVTDTRNEDTGIDGRLNAIEQPDASLVTATGDDPAGDDFHAPDVDNKVPIHNLDPDRWLRINGTEGNKSVYPFPDTEDLNLNNSLDTDENYFEYTVDLGTSSPYLADSVYASGRRYTNNGDAVPADNGWRRYRIPMTDTLRVKFGSPDLTLARHVRVWLDGITAADDQVSPSIAEKRPIVMLGGLDIVGSRWIAKDLPPGQVASGTTMTLNSVNNVDNADIYTPPFDPGSTRNGAQDLVRREQSLALEWTKLQPDDSLEAYKTFSLDEDYSRYGTLRWYVAGFGIPNYIPATGNLYYFMRFASDELGRSYYEYRAPVPPSSSPGAIAWSQVAIKLTELSNLKLAHSATPDSIDVPRPNGAPGERLIVHGRPSFTRLRRISFGVLNLDGARVYDAGRVWLDEIRATDVARDRGHAERVAVNGRMANLLDYSVNYSGQDENFLSVGQTRGSGSRTNQIAANANVDLHRFFEGTGILLPVSLTYSGNRAQPRYTAGDDVFRTGADALASESRGTTRSYSVRYSRNWGERSNPLLRYTLGGITANLGQSVTENSNPAAVDTSRALQAGVSYNISPRALVAIPIPGTKARFYPLPDRFFWNYTIATSSARSYDRQRDAPDSLLLRSATTGRTAYIDFGADSRPFDLIHHQFQGRRNLTLPEQLREQIGFINFGKVVQWNQSMDTNFGVRRGPWIQPQFGWNASYTQNNGPELSPDLSVRAVGNAQSYRLGWTLPFDQLGAAKTGARRDSLHRGPAPWMVALSKLGAVSADASYNQGSSYSRLSGTPRLGYLFGLESDPGFSGPVLAQFGNASTLTEEWRSAVRSKVGLFLGASAQTHGEFSARRASNNGVLNRENRTMFPDLDFDFGKVPEAVGLTKIFSNPRLRTAYSQSRTTDYANSPTPTSISSSSEWRPLLGLTGDLKNGTRCEFRIQHRSTQSKYMQVGSSTTSDANTDVDLSLTRAYTKGQKVSILGRESTVKTSVNLGLTGTYSRHDSETRQEGYAQPFNPISEDRLSLNGTGAYGFSSNVTGNVELGFSQTRDLQKDIVTRSIRVELRAQFGF